MCGIGGIVSTNNSKIDQNIANDMKVSLEHRGPDYSSINYISLPLIIFQIQNVLFTAGFQLSI